MAMPRDLAENRLSIGQLLARLLHEYRSHLMGRARDRDYVDVRPAHLQIWANIGAAGIRLTDLADRANLSLPACSELIDQLEDLDYVERRPDPSDGRAKLIFPTARGRGLLDETDQALTDLERAWGRAIGARRFEEACAALNHLLAVLGDPEAADLESAEPSRTVGEFEAEEIDEAESEAEIIGPEPEPDTAPQAAQRIPVFTPGPRPGEFRIRR